MQQYRTFTDPKHKRQKYKLLIVLPSGFTLKNQCLALGGHRVRDRRRARGVRGRRGDRGSQPTRGDGWPTAHQKCLSEKRYASQNGLQAGKTIIVATQPHANAHLEMVKWYISSEATTLQRQQDKVQAYVAHHFRCYQHTGSDDNNKQNDNSITQTKLVNYQNISNT